MAAALLARNPGLTLTVTDIDPAITPAGPRDAPAGVTPGVPNRHLWWGSGRTAWDEVRDLPNG